MIQKAATHKIWKFANQKSSVGYPIRYGKIFSKGFTALNEWPMNGQFCEASG